MLVPSRFEPCGLIQLHAMSYGTVPVVSSTGGLVDTVKDGVTGFHAGRFNPDRLEKKDAESLTATIRRAAEAFSGPSFLDMRERCIVQELGWDKPARKWQSVLEELWLSPPTSVPRFPLQKAQFDVQEERKVAYPTPVQEVNLEGDAVPQKAMAKKAAAQQSILERVKPKGIEQPAVPSASQGTSRPVIPATEAVPNPIPTSSASQDPSEPPASPALPSGSAGSSAIQNSPLRAAAAKTTTAKTGSPSSTPQKLQETATSPSKRTSTSIRRPKKAAGGAGSTTTASKSQTSKKSTDEA